MVSPEPSVEKQQASPARELRLGLSHQFEERLCRLLEALVAVNDVVQSDCPVTTFDPGPLPFAH